MRQAGSHVAEGLCPTGRRFAGADWPPLRWDDVELTCGACAEVAGDNLDDDLANVLVRMPEEAKRGRRPLDPLLQYLSKKAANHHMMYYLEPCD